jgi:hypothetical protein
MKRTTVLAWLVLAAAPLLGACYVDAGPPPPAGVYVRGGYQYNHSYEWHNYGRPPPPR